MSKPFHIMRKTAVSATYCWLYEDFPKDKDAEFSKTFTTDLCGHPTTWSMHVNYVCPEAKMRDDDPYTVELIHHGRSIFNVTPVITVAFSTDKAPPIFVKKSVQCNLIKGDWEYFVMDLNDLKFDWAKIIELDYDLDIEASITYNLSKKCNTDEVWLKHTLKSQRGSKSSFDEKLLTKATNNDFEVVVGTEKFYVHRPRLIERSIVFYRMYNSAENNKDEVLRIDNAKADVVREMLRYCCTGTLYDINDDIAIDLLELAYRYEIPLLKTECETIINLFKIEKSAEMADLADHYKLKELKKYIERSRR